MDLGTFAEMSNQSSKSRNSMNQHPQLLMNTGRQELLGTLLSSYANTPAAMGEAVPPRQFDSRKPSQEANYPSYYLNFRDSISAPTLGSRGNSFLHHLGPVPRLNGYSSTTPQNLPNQSRSNSIFSSLAPPLANATSSGSDGSLSEKYHDGAKYGDRPQEREIGISRESLEDIEKYLDREYWNTLNWQQMSGSLDRKPHESFSLWGNPGIPGSISGLNINMNDLIAEISSSADYASMSNEQRRSSIIRALNNQSRRNLRLQDPVEIQGKLREDIFDKTDTNAQKMSKGEMGTGGHLAPDARKNQYMEDPPSPRAYSKYDTQGVTPQMRDLRNFHDRNYVGALGPFDSKSNDSEASRLVVNLSKEPTNENLVKVQEYFKSEDGRPLLGATKIDELMLMIQDREREAKNHLQQDPDGNLLAELPGKRPYGQAVVPGTATLIRGVSTDDAATEDESRKRAKASKVHECPYCHKPFSQSTHLEVHVRSHIGYKPFECAYCNKRFTQGGNLRTHLRVHTGEKPFTCELCHQSFNRKGNLAAHKLTHENVKPYACKLDDCDKSFTQLGNLKSHQNKFHLNTLNELTRKLAELNDTDISRLPKEEIELLSYFKGLYKNSNKGIRGRGRKNVNQESSSEPKIVPLNPPSVGKYDKNFAVPHQPRYGHSNQYHKNPNPQIHSVQFNSQPDLSQ